MEYISMQEEEKKEKQWKKVLNAIRKYLVKFWRSLKTCILWLLSLCKFKEEKSSEIDYQIGAGSYIAEKGILNYGNTCYLNSVLQILASTPEFFNNLNPNCKLSATLYRIINMVNEKSETDYKPEIEYLLKLINPKYSKFILGEQNDCKELFAILIRKCAKSNEKLKDLFYIREFQTIIRSCNHTENREEMMAFLIVPEKFNKDISSSIKSSEETIFYDGKDKLYCDTCEELKDTKINTVYILPNILALYFASEGPQEKNIDYSQKFKGKEYELYGVICFYPSYNHYVAFSFKNGRWFEYNDESKYEKVPDKSFAYMAFYRRIG